MIDGSCLRIRQDCYAGQAKPKIVFLSWYLWWGIFLRFDSIRLVCLAVMTAAWSACSGSGSSPNYTIPVGGVGGPLAADPFGVQIGSQPMSATLPPVSQITGTIAFPAVVTPDTILLEVSATPPAAAALSAAPAPAGGAVTVYEYVAMISANTVTLPSIPALTFQFPAIALAGQPFFYGISDPNSQGGLISYVTQGPANVNGQTVAFPAIAVPLTLLAGHQYTIVLYGTGRAR